MPAEVGLQILLLTGFVPVAKGALTTSGSSRSGPATRIPEAVVITTNSELALRLALQLERLRGFLVTF